MTAYTPSAHEVETFTGRYVDTKHPKPSTICLEDIAHALAATCRYGGHCQRFYSVAEHAVMVSKRLERRGYPVAIQLGGLNHDDAEAFLGDIPRPMKKLLGRAYEILTERMDNAIALALDLDVANFHHPAVKDADNWALFVEARHLLPSRGVNWSGSALEQWNVTRDTTKRIVTPDYWTGGLSPSIAESLFLARYRELTKGV